MKKYFGLLLICVLISCKPRTVENNGGLIIDLVINDKTVSEKDIATTINILRNRIDYFCYYNPRITLESDKKTIQIKLPLAKDSTLYKEYILAKGKLNILETYENKDIYKCLMSINEKLFRNHNFNFKIPINSLNRIENLPLFRILRPSISWDGNIINGPVIGYSKDTALVNSILKFKEFHEFLPLDSEFKWSKIDNSSFFSLIAIKKPINYKTITSDMVIKSRATKSGSNKYETYFILKPEYCQLWADLTRNNIGKALAITIDNYVFSYPTVTSEIKSGRTTLSSNMTIQQAKALSTTLQYGEIPIEFEIKRIKEIYVP